MAPLQRGLTRSVRRDFSPWRHRCRRVRARLEKSNFKLVRAPELPLNGERACVRENSPHFPERARTHPTSSTFSRNREKKTRLRKIFPNLANESENFRGYFNVGRWVFRRDFRFGRRSRGKIFFPPAHTDRTKLCVNFNIFLRSAQIAYAWTTRGDVLILWKEKNPLALDFSPCANCARWKLWNLYAECEFLRRWRKIWDLMRLICCNYLINSITTRFDTVY